MTTGTGGSSVVRLSPDGRSVVYAADQEVDGRYELYSRPIDGSGSPTRLNGPLVAGGDAWTFSIGPDGQRVAYTADQDTDTVYELYASPLERSSPPDPHAGSAPVPTRSVTVVR